MSLFSKLFKRKKKKPVGVSIPRDETGRWIHDVPATTKTKLCGCQSGKVCPCEKKLSTIKVEKPKPVAKKPASKPVAKKATTAKKPVAKKTSTPKKK